MNFRNWALVALTTALLAGCNYKPVPELKISANDAKLLAKAETAPVDHEFERYEIDDVTGEAPGTITIGSKAHLLYFSLPNKKAIRYGVATGNEAAGWTGNAYVGRMAALDATGRHARALAASEANRRSWRFAGRSG